MIDTNQWTHDTVTYYRGYTLIHDPDCVTIFDMHMEQLEVCTDEVQAQKIIDDWHNAK